MNSKSSDILLKICNIFNRNKVEYLLVGGAAVALHGYYRLSMNLAGLITEKPDLDFWYNPNYYNYFNLLNALEELGKDVVKFKKELSPNPHKSFFRYEFENLTLDLLPHIKAPLLFRKCFEQKETVTFGGVEIFFIGLNDLIADKEASARPKDMEDIKHLKAIRDQR